MLIIYVRLCSAALRQLQEPLRGQKLLVEIEGVEETFRALATAFSQMLPTASLLFFFFHQVILVYWHKHFKCVEIKTLRQVSMSIALS